MNVREMIDYLTHYADHGYDKANIVICGKHSNPLIDVKDIYDALLIESKDGDFYIVLQTE